VNETRLLAAAAALSLFATACPQKPPAKADFDAAPAPPASSAATAPTGPPTQCTDTECDVTSITDKVKADLEAVPNHEQLKIVFGKDTAPADLKTVSKIPWVTWLRVESDQIADTFALLPLTNLQKLEIGATKISSLAGLAVLSGLTDFDAHGLSTLSDITALGNHTNLANVNLSDTAITDLRSLNDRLGLVRLEIARTKVKDLKPLENHTKLEWLDLQGSSVKTVDSLAGDTALKTLILTKTDIGDLSALKTCVALEDFEAANAKFADLAGLKGAKKLTTLNLAGASRVTDLKPLYDDKAVVTLDLSNTNVNDVAALVQMKGLKTLNLNGTHVRDVNVLTVLPALEEIHLNGTYVQDIGPLSRLKKLKKLVLPKWFPQKKIDDFTKTAPNVAVTQGED
jgi:internalin A